MNDAPHTVCIDPASGEEIGRSPLHGVDELRAALDRARQAQRVWAALPLRERSRAVLRMRDYICANADRIARTVSRDNGKTMVDALVTEVLAMAVVCNHYAKRAPYYLRERRLPMGSWLLFYKRAKMVRVPFGVVGIISPWNYPFSIPFYEVVMGLIAGNAVILKAASQTQLSGLAIAECVAAAGLPDGLFTYLNLPGRVAGDAMLEAGIDKLFFTGSVPVGKRLMAKAAETLTRVSLELGGNDAMLVCPDADLERAALGAIWGGLQNCGQSCGGVERIYVHREVYQPFLEILGRRVRALRVGKDLEHQVDLGAMTTTGQQQEVQRQIDEALAMGATIFAQSACPEGGPGQFLPATVLTDVTHQMRVMREETFGPVLGVMQVDDMDQAIALANDSDLGLTGSVWSRDRAAAERLARRIRAGAVTINDHLMSHGMAETPWGGFKNSGIGRTHGDVGFDEMTEPQCIVDDLMPYARRQPWWHPHGPEVYRGLLAFLDVAFGQGLWRRLRAVPTALRLFMRMFDVE